MNVTTLRGLKRGLIAQAVATATDTALSYASPQATPLNEGQAELAAAHTSKVAAVSMPSTELSSLLLTHDASLRVPVAHSDGFIANNPRQRMTARFDEEGATIRSRMSDWTWGLSLKSWGYEGNEVTVDAAVPPIVQRTEVQYHYQGGLIEWWDNSANGFEHGFTVSRRPEPMPDTDDAAKLVFDLQVLGDLTASTSEDRKTVTFSRGEGEALFEYADLLAVDANGIELDAWIDVSPGRLRISVQDQDAAYPLTIDPVVQQEVFIKAPNANKWDMYGWSVAISGDTVVVGAQKEDSVQTNPAIPIVEDDTGNNYWGRNIGAAYVYARDCSDPSAHWKLQAYLKPPSTDENPADWYYFGESVAIDGDVIFVGAPQMRERLGFDQCNNLTGPFVDTGKVYSFTRSGTTWTYETEIAPDYHSMMNPGTAVGDRFGTSLAVSGDYLVVGAPEEDSKTDQDQSNDVMQNAGAAYVFHRAPGGTYTEVSYLKSPVPFPCSQFGWSVAIDGDVIVVGEDRRMGIEGDKQGSAHVFERNGAAWGYSATLKSSHEQAAALFGSAVAIDGDQIAVGAPGQGALGSTGLGDGRGAVYYYERQPQGNWGYPQRLDAFNHDPNDNFGFALALLGDRLAVGARREEGRTGNPGNDSGDSTGAVYLFSRAESGGWDIDEASVEYIKERHPQARSYFGRTMAMTTDSLVVGAVAQPSQFTGIGAVENDSQLQDAGAAYVFMLDPMEIGTPVPSCSALGYSTLLPGEIVAYGDTSTACNRVVLAAKNIPDNSIGKFFVSNATQSSLSGFCLSGTIASFPAQDLNSREMGEFSATIDLSSLPSFGAVMAGNTYYFSARYEFTPSGSSLPLTLSTNAIGITFF